MIFEPQPITPLKFRWEVSNIFLVNPTSCFFKEEVGLRDLTVTGVQTCALPISMGGELCWQSCVSPWKYQPLRLPSQGLSNVCDGGNSALPPCPLPALYIVHQMIGDLAHNLRSRHRAQRTTHGESADSASDTGRCGEPFRTIPAQPARRF